MTDLTQHQSLTSVLRHRVHEHADEDALVWVHDAQRRVATHLTYAELDREARGVASLLQHLLPAGSRVLLLYPPVHYVVGFLACVYAGMVAVPAPLPGRYRHERRRVVGIAGDAGVAAVLTDGSNLADVRELVRSEGFSGLPVIPTDDGSAADPDAWSPVAADQNTLAMLQYTSGSTGEPKGVMVTHGNLLANATSLYGTLGVSAGTRFGGWAPHYHDMGLMAQTLPALFLGSACVLMNATAFLKQPFQWLNMIDKYDIGWSAAPNFAYELCTGRVSDEQLADLDLSRWWHAVNGSEPVQVSTMLDFTERFARAGFSSDAARPCYGLAEATVFVAGARSRPLRATTVDVDLLARDRFVPVAGPQPGRDLPSNGYAPFFDVLIVDPRTRAVLPDGQVGEIWLRGDSVARGYWCRDEATDSTFRASTADGDTGYLRTGDLGTKADGELYISGRLKDVLIVHGRNLYPQDIEHELRVQHPRLGNVGAVFTVPTPQGAQHAGDALVVTHEVAGRPERRELADLAMRMKQTVSREFGAATAGVLLLSRGSVRRTTSGKVQRAAMREQLLSGTLAAEYIDAEPWLERLSAGTDTVREADAKEPV